MINPIILDVIDPVEPQGVQITDVLVYVIPIVIIGIGIVVFIHLRKKRHK